MVLMLILLAACGSGGGSQAGDDAGTNGANQNQSGSASNEKEGASDKGAAAGSGETITYKAFNGEIQVPKDPKRVVEVSDNYVGYLLKLGIKPVGVKKASIENPYFKGMLDGVENLGDGNSVEQILALQPDLIIAPSYMDAALLEKLAQIAPTVAIEYGKLRVRDQMLEIGKLTSREDKAKEWIASWDKQIADAKPKVQAAVGDKTVSILQPYAKGIYAFGHNFGRGGEIIYTELELKAPEAIQKEAIDSGQGWASLSLEKLPDYAGDFIFTSPWTGDNADPEAVYGSSIWKGLPAVQNNRVYRIVREGSFFSDPVSMEGQLKFIVESLTNN